MTSPTNRPPQRASQPQGTHGPLVRKLLAGKGAPGTTATAASASGSRTVPVAPKPLLGETTRQASSGPSCVAPGRVLGPYKLEQAIGRGGMGTVYRARHSRLGTLCAVKVFLPGDSTPKEMIQRFEREARSVAGFGKQPNIVHVFDLGYAEGAFYYAMELVDGTPLDRVLTSKDAPLDLNAKVLLLKKVALAIHFAHGRRIVHRDLKPSNILVRKDGEPQVTDFGLACDLSRVSRVSSPDQVMGSPAYFSPEQARGDTRATDARTDVYGLGAILYEMLTGLPPNQGDTMEEVLRAAREGRIPPPRKRDPGVPKDIETVCLKCLELDPDRRYQAAQELAGDLDRFLRHVPVKARPIGGVERGVRWVRRNVRLVAACAVGLALAAGAFWSWHKGKHDVAETQTRAEKDKQAAVADAETRAAEKGKEEVKQAQRETLWATGDDLARKGKWKEALVAYDAVYGKADEAGKKRILQLMIPCAGGIEVVKAAEAWRTLLKHDPELELGDFNGACAEALAEETDTKGGEWGPTWRHDLDAARLAVKRIEFYLGEKKVQNWPFEVAQEYLDDIRDTMAAFPKEEQDSLGLPKDDTETLAKRADDPVAEGWARAGACLALGARIEKDDPKGALARYRQAQEWFLRVFPFRAVQTHSVEWVAGERGRRDFGSPQWTDDPREARLVRLAEEGVRRLDSSEPDRFRGSLEIVCSGCNVLPQGMVPVVRVCLSAGKLSQPGEDPTPPMTPQWATVCLKGDRATLGVAEGEYVMTIEEWAAQEDRCGALDEGRSFGLEIDAKPRFVTIKQGEETRVEIAMRRLLPVDLVPLPREGMSLDGRKPQLAWKPVDGAKGYRVTVEAHETDADGNEAYAALARVEVDVREALSVTLADLLARKDNSESDPIRVGMARGGVTLRWGVDALDAGGRRIGSSGKLQVLPLAERGK